MGVGGDLVTKAGHVLPELDWGPSTFLDKSIVIYGPTGTGKSAIVKGVMRSLQPCIDQILVVSPTEPTNRTYEGFVDAPLIHYRPWLPDPKNPKKTDDGKGALRFLEAVWKRQEMMSSIYRKANRPAALASLFERLPREARYDGYRIIDRINGKRVRSIARLREGGLPEEKKDEKIKEMNENFKTLVALLYKRYITPHYRELWEREDLSEDERYCLRYLHFRPRLLLIFDDCAAQLKPLFTKEIFRSLFYQGRWASITFVLCCQDDTDLLTNLRKNAYITFFTTGVTATSNFERGSNKYPKVVQQFVREVWEEVFAAKHRKLAFIREDPRGLNFYHCTAPYPRKFHFGSAAVHELCAAVGSAEMAMDKENPYYEHFRV